MVQTKKKTTGMISKFSFFFKKIIGFFILYFSFCISLFLSIFIYYKYFILPSAVNWNLTLVVIKFVLLQLFGLDLVYEPFLPLRQMQFLDIPEKKFKIQLLLKIFHNGVY